MSDPAFKLIGAPPAKSAPPTPENVSALEAWLSSIVAFRPLTSERPWTFYEQMELYLGPWGASGYPISYGKKYCILFHGDEKLNANLAGKAWVRRTLIKLQLALKRFVLARFKAGTLAAVSKDEFTRVAFDSHPQAYTQGGLSMVLLLSPGLVFHLASIPAVEFLPWSANFGPTIQQVLITGGLMVPDAVGMLAAAPILPAHVPLWGRATAMDRRRFDEDQLLGKRLAMACRAVQVGAADSVELLDRLRRSVTQLELPDRSLAALARQLISAIDARRALLKQRYAREIAADPELRESYKLFDRMAVP